MPRAGRRRCPALDVGLRRDRRSESVVSPPRRSLRRKLTANALGRVASRTDSSAAAPQRVQKRSPSRLEKCTCSRTAADVADDGPVGDDTLARRARGDDVPIAGTGPFPHSTILDRRASGDAGPVSVRVDGRAVGCGDVDPEVELPESAVVCDSWRSRRTSLVEHRLLISEGRARDAGGRTAGRASRTRPRSRSRGSSRWAVDVGCERHGGWSRTTGRCRAARRRELRWCVRWPWPARSEGPPTGRQRAANSSPTGL